MPAYGALNSSFTVNGAVHDPLTGLDTGSGNDRLIGIDTGSGNDHIVHHVGTTSGPGGTTYFSGYSEAVGLDGYMVCPEPPFLKNIGTTSGPGGTTFFTDNIGSTSGPGGTTFFTDNIGSTSGPGGTTYMTGVDHLGQFGHEADHFTNFAMPVGDFI